MLGLIFAACSQPSSEPAKETRTKSLEPLKVISANAWELPPVFNKGNTFSFSADGVKTADDNWEGFFSYKVMEVSGKWVRLEQDKTGKRPETLARLKNQISKHIEELKLKPHETKYGDPLNYCKDCQGANGISWWISDVGWWNTDYMRNAVLVESAARAVDQ